jgi:3-methyladenine DNA glycosylase/8-oxoguanine DNA glycosylase
VKLSGQIQRRVIVPGIIDAEWLFGFLRLREVPWVERTEGNRYERLLHLPEGYTVLQIEAVGTPRRALLAATTTPRLPPARTRALAARLFDLDARLEDFHRVAKADSILGPLLERRPWIRLPRIPDGFEGMARAVLGQQVSVRAASTMVNRLIHRFGVPLSGKTLDRFRGFPTPRRLLRAGNAALERLGITRARAKALLTVAEALDRGQLDWEHLEQLPEIHAVQLLCELPGIGPWTASYLRMRVLGDRDAFPATDLGIVKALGARGVQRERVLAAAEPWRPWRAYAAIHLWHAGVGGGTTEQRTTVS